MEIQRKTISWNAPEQSARVPRLARAKLCGDHLLEASWKVST